MKPELSPSELNELTQKSIELGMNALKFAKEKPKAFLLIQSGVNEDINSAVREELIKRGIPFQEFDLKGQKLDDGWPTFPAIGCRAFGLIGSFKKRETIEAIVNSIK